MIYQVPSHFFLCAGCAEGRSPLNAFDQALLDAGVGDTNLVRMSSILPPYCQQVEPFDVPAGALVPTAYGAMRSSTPGQRIAAAVAIAISDRADRAGLIMEHHGAAPLAQVTDEVRQMAIAGMEHRHRPIAEILTTGVDYQVQRCAAVFAGVVLWNGPDGGR